MNLIEKAKDKWLDFKIWRDWLPGMQLLKKCWKKYHWKTLWIIPTLIVTLWFAVAWLVVEHDRVVVTDKDIKSDGIEIVEVYNKKTGQMESASGNIDRYFIYTDKGPFVIKDNWFFLQWTASDQYGYLMRDKEYDIWHFGIRFPYFGLNIYENIVFWSEAHD